MRVTLSWPLIFTAVIFTSCTKKTQESAQQTPAKPEPVTEAPRVGGDKDEHGCIGSAGYTWSVLKNECIRLFEAGIRLDPQAAIADKTVSAFIVFKSADEDAKAEVFLPGEHNARMFVKQANNPEGSAGTWKSGDFTIKYWKGMYMLEDAHEKMLYQGMWDNK